MEAPVKNKEKPEIKLLSKLKDRLLNLSTREQKINLRPYQKATYDLVSLLSKTCEKFIEQFEVALLSSLLTKNREKTVSVATSSIFRLIEEGEDKEKYKERLNYLRRFSNKLYVEKGYKGLYAGFLFFRGYFVNSQKLLRVVNAPLFLFPADLQKKNGLEIVISKSKKINYTLLYFLRKELEIENDIFTQTITKLEKINSDDFKHLLIALKPIITRLFLDKKIKFGFSFTLNNFLKEPSYSFAKIFETQKNQGKEKKNLLETFFALSLAEKPSSSQENYLEVVGNLVLLLDKGTNLSLFNDFERILTKFQTEEEKELANSAFGFLFKSQEKTEEEKNEEESKKVIYTPLLSDPSQTRVLEKIFNNFWEKVLCIDGPPGTGKTQLISNLLVNGLFYDQKILIVCEKNAALEVIANNLNSLGMGTYFIKMNELNQVSEIFRYINNALAEKQRGIISKKWEVEVEKIKELEKKKKDFLTKINDYCQIEKNFYSRHNISLSEVYLKNTHQENIPSEIIELTAWVETKTDLTNLKKDLDNYFEKLGQLLEKNFLTCLRLKHLLRNDKLDFEFSLETKNKFHNLISNFLVELEGKNSSNFSLSSITSSFLLSGINEKYSFLISNALRKHAKEIADLSKKEDLDSFFSFLNLSNLAEFQESCLDANFLNKINKFIEQEFFLLGDLNMLFSNCNQGTKKIIHYFLEISFQKDSLPNYNEWIRIIEKGVYFNWLNEVEENERDKLWNWNVGDLEKGQKKHFKIYWEKLQITQSLIQSKQKEKRNNTPVSQDLSAELKKKRNLNLRKIFLPLLDHFPIWLTTPETIASLTSLEAPLFDYLIFDEASQIPLEKSVPLFTRAKKVIVIGDQQQLPPTDFFKSFWEEEEEEWLAEEIQEQKKETFEAIKQSEINLEISDLGKGSSLLDYVKKYAQQTQSYTLSWHYRSHYPQLIEFSNQAFYGGNLEIISKKRDWEIEHSPIEYHRVNGYWIDQQNPVEAQAILKLLESLPTDKEVGIITFNTKQRDLLEDLIEEKKQEISNLFVRNLEEVQGDERDIIIFSIGYGPNKEGNFTHNFGPLNREGGEKRLNVAITRTREKVIVVTSILPSQLKVDNAKHLGSKFLKLYLEYAQVCQKRDNNKVEKLLNDKVAKLINFNRQKGQITDSNLSFKKAVYDELVKLGYEINFQESSISHCDLVVRSSQNKQYILGIKCDGWTCYSEKEEQIEIDNYRQMLLEKHDWKIIKVLSRDWWRNKKREIQRIKRKIESLEVS